MQIIAMTEGISYKRLDHFKWWLSHMLTHTVEDVPQTVIEKVVAFLPNVNDFDTSDVRNVMKKLRLHKYLEYSGFIYKRIKGIQPFTMTSELEQELIAMFIIVNKAYADYSRTQRKRSFFSYHYLICKFMEILGHPEHMEYYAHTTHPIKRKNNEDFFAAICGGTTLTN